MGRVASHIAVERNKALMNSYKKIAPYCKTQNEAWVRTVTSPAPRYYCTISRAKYVLSPMTIGDNRNIEVISSEEQRKMYYSLWEKMKELSQQYVYARKSFDYILCSAIHSSAPQYFLRPRTMRLVYKRKKEELANRIKKNKSKTAKRWPKPVTSR